MKQNIECSACAHEWIRGPAHKGEYVRVVFGTMTQEQYALCDGCNVGLRPGERVAAVSVWTDRIPFIEGWEDVYFDGELQVARDDRRKERET